MFNQAFTTLQFYLYGKKHCTKTGWHSESSKYSKPDILESIKLTGKVFMVTGANNGIGYGIASFLAEKGGIVYLVCRNAERGKKAADELSAKFSNPNVHLLIGDCSLEVDVRRVWNEFRNHQISLNNSENVQLNALICNAGALDNSLTLSNECVEVTFAAHLLFGTYLLTELAMPVLAATPDSRVIAVSSGGMYNTKFPKWEIATSQEGEYSGQMAYAYAKRGQVLLCEEWAKSYPNITFVSCHPGWVDTPGVQAAYGTSKSYLEPLRNLWEGCEGIIYLAVVPADQGKLVSGAFYLDRTPQIKHLSGWWFSEGTYTKNTPEEVSYMMDKLKKWSCRETRLTT